VLMAALCIAMTWLVWRNYGSAGVSIGGTGSPLGLLAGADLVIAMSVSWVPLVADYARYARSSRGAAIGTFWGYFVGGTWMYATGLLIALATKTDAPDQMVVQVMSEPGVGWAMLAAVLVLISTVTTTFLDIFSTAVSAQNFAPKLSLRVGITGCGVLGALCALSLNVHGYTPFLLAIGELFLPAFTVVMTDYFLVRRQQLSMAATDPLGSTLAISLYPAWMVRAWNWPGIVAWIVGIAVFDWAGGGLALTTFGALFGLSPNIKAWPTGASLPCIVVTAIAYILLARLSGTSRNPQSSL
jgi:NCS1 family nucleobase:cation symporter-1